uniref:Uncharacterized protein n=1 Tax=Bostrychia moritziana TaxID=103713 RepID=A0A1Z1M6D9_BOSMO|nr:hypothetical protein [Bostrychia moritziana]ARW61658.1 hypothetical protein [Bostrychia moritziana]
MYFYCVLLICHKLFMLLLIINQLYFFPFINKLKVK